MPRLRAAAPHLVAVLSAVVVLGPALAPGLVLTYDLGWSPDPRLTPAVLGLDTPAPRVLPSDVLAVALSAVLTAGAAQKVVLLGSLVAASLGTVRLLTTVLGRRPGQVAAIGAVLAAQWNPFVAERLAIGQWTVLWGYALLPWAWAAALRVRSGDRVTPLLAVIATSALGGANSLAIIALAVLPTVLWPPVPRRAVGLILLTTIGGSAVWAVPALVAGASGDPAGVAAFATRADTPLGLLGSVLSGGGIWNVSAWPSERSTWVLASAALLVALGGAASLLVDRRKRWCGPLLAGAVPWLLLALVSGWPPLRPVWETVLAIPGGGLLRDAHKMVAPWVVLCALGLALAVERWATSERPARRALGWGAALVPVPLLVSMAWGLSGQLDAVSVPDDVRAAARSLSAEPPEPVGLLPWNQYRRYAWNDDRISLSVIPRMVDHPVLQDDSLPLRDRRIAGERPDSAQVSAAIGEGEDPVEALEQQGVRYLVVERGAVPAAPEIPGDARVRYDGPHVTVLELGAGTPADPPGWTAVRAGGWILFLATEVGVLVAVLRATARRRSNKQV